MTTALTPEQAYLATVAELNALATRAKHVTHEDVLRIASMSADDLRRRAIVALDWHGCFSHCLDGMPELKAIPGGAPDGCWLPGPVRGVVAELLRRSELTYEDTCFGRLKSPSPDAQRIEALEAELAACKRDAERLDKLAELMFAADFDYGEDGLSVLVFLWPKNVPVGADLRRNIDAALAAQEKTV
jgi:hypothetical protein